MRLFFPLLCGGHLRGSVCATRSIKDCAEKSSHGRSQISKTYNRESHSNGRGADDEEEENEDEERNCNDDR